MASARTATRRATRRTVAVALVVVVAGVTTACAAGSHLLTGGDGWELEVLPGPRLELSVGAGDGSHTSGVSEYTRPVTLDEAVGFAVPHDGDDVTLLAGPVDEEARAVRVESVDGEVVDATLDAAHGLTWFWATLPGAPSIAAITAYDADGDVVDEYTLPPMPPPPDASIPAPRDATDDLG
jgi:hypothetical protein